MVAAANELEAYLQEKREVVISWVEPRDDHIRVWLDLNAGVQEDDKPAAEVCGLIKKSGIEAAENVRIVDLGDEAFPACWNPRRHCGRTPAVRRYAAPRPRAITVIAAVRAPPTGTVE